MRKKSAQKITVALAGNPNVGKSTLFNSVTGMHQHTGNWPGKTVDVATGQTVRGQVCYEFVDLPGTYGLSGISEDEIVAGEYITSGNADCTLVVCDGSALERTLVLALQIMAMTERVALCVNLMDEAEKNGIEVNQKALEKELGVPVIFTSVNDKTSSARILDVIDQCLHAEHLRGINCEDPVAEAQRIASVCVTVSDRTRIDFFRRADKALVSRRFGIPIMLLLLVLILWITIWGANYPSELLSRGFGVLYVYLGRWLSFLPIQLRGLLLDGMYATATRVLSVMLPPMAIFFPLFTVLEDVGYLPRMAFLLDGKMCRCGGCGKQALTLCMGLGCNAVGVMGCRIIDSPKERFHAMMTNAMVPCNGRFPTLITLSVLFFSGMGAGVGVACCVVFGIMAAMLCTRLLNCMDRTKEKNCFLMEMPPFRRPRIGQILVRSLIDRTIHISLRALKVAVPAGALLWVLANTSAFSFMTELLDPIGKSLGMNGLILLAFCFSLPANELFLPVLLMGLTGGQSVSEAGALTAQMLVLSGWTWKTAVCTLLFTLFHWPCATTLMTVYRETRSKKQTAAACLLPTAVGVILCALTHFLLLWV